MNSVRDSFDTGPQVVVIGAGVGGLVSALLARASGARVTLCERHGWAGGKLRALASSAGPVAAGPTVLTMRHVFDDVFSTCGARLDDHVRLTREPLLARHFWRDGSRLDLWDDVETSAGAVEAFAGRRAARAFRAFSQDAAELFAMFDEPMMRRAEPDPSELALRAARAPRHLATLRPGRSLAAALKARFPDPRLRQLFGRYATYVGGMPERSPALLQLIWQAESAGVWRAEDGLHRLAEAMAERFTQMGGRLLCGHGVRQIEVKAGRVRGVVLEDRQRLPADAVIFNGDPRALATGRLGDAVREVAQVTRDAPRSLSARVWSFAARLDEAPDLAHHNVFFGADPQEEFAAISAGRMPKDPTVYVCAQDRGTGLTPPEGGERFEIILNAAPLTEAQETDREVETCLQTTTGSLGAFGMRFQTPPKAAELTIPEDFENLFPASAGSLYGSSPHGMMSALQRPRARTAIRGLYLAGGGVHPGPGLPMAALSGRHAAEAIMTDLVST